MRKVILNIKNVIVTFISFVIIIDKAFAVPPPDFIIQIASQIGTFFAVGIALSTGIFSIVYQYIKGYAKNNKKTFWTICISLIILVSWIGAYFFDQYIMQEEQTNINGEWINNDSK